jgi:hypothetical protein
MVKQTSWGVPVGATLRERNSKSRLFAQNFETEWNEMGGVSTADLLRVVSPKVQRLRRWG